jgi:hypothetical protein
MAGQLQLSFSLLLPLSPALGLSILQLVLNDGRKFEHIIETSFLYGVEPITGLLCKSASHLFFVEGLRLLSGGIASARAKPAGVLYGFDLSSFVAGHFGPCSLFESHPVVTWPTNGLLSPAARGPGCSS